MKTNYSYARFTFIFFLAFLFGIISVHNFINFTPTFLILFIVSVCLFLIFALFCFKKIILIIAVVGILLGNCFYFIGVSLFFSGVKNTSSAVVSGYVSDDISSSEFTTSLILRDVSINGDDSKNIALRINNDISISLEPGEWLIFVADLEKVNLFSFGYINSYYFRNNAPYTATVYASDIVKSETHTDFDEKFRLKVKGLLYSKLSNQNADISYALLFGDRSNISDVNISMFNDSNVLHLFAVSGLHVGFLVALLAFILDKLNVNFYINFITSGVFVFAYSYLCGFAPSVLRAMIMAYVLSFSYITGREYDGLSSLGLAGTITLIFSPLSAFDIGFLMSYFCVILILFSAKPITKFLLKFFPKIFAEGIAISISAQLGVLPFVSSLYSSFNFISPIINLLIVPIFSVLFPILFLSVLLVIIMPFLSFIFVIPNLILNFVMLVLSFFSSTVLSINLLPLNPFYSVCIIFTAFIFSRFVRISNLMKMFSFSVILFSISCSHFFTSLPSENISYISYFTHDTLVVRNKKGNVALIDPYESSSLKNVLNKNNIYSFDLVFFIDEYPDMELVENYSADKVYVYSDLIEETSCDGFVFNYIYYEEKFVGLSLFFDDTSIFFARSSSLSYNICDYVNSFDFDFVVIGDKSSFASSIDSKVLCYKSQSKKTFSYSNYGNFFLKKKRNKFIIRSYD